MQRDMILGHVMLTDVLPVLGHSSRCQCDSGSNSIAITFLPGKFNFQPVIQVAIILKEKIRAVGIAGAVANKQIQKSVVVVIDKSRVASSSTFLRSYPD